MSAVPQLRLQVSRLSYFSQLFQPQARQLASSERRSRTSYKRGFSKKSPKCIRGSCQAPCSCRIHRVEFRVQIQREPALPFIIRMVIFFINNERRVYFTGVSLEAPPPPLGPEQRSEKPSTSSIAPGSW